MYADNSVKCRLIAHERCCTTTITFFKDKYKEEEFIKFVNDFQCNDKIHKIIKIENGIEEIIANRKEV